MTKNVNVKLSTLCLYDSISIFIFNRLVYFNSNAQCLPQVTNPNQPKYPYYYERAGEVAKSMRNALALNGNIQY